MILGLNIFNYNSNEVGGLGVYIQNFIYYFIFFADKKDKLIVITHPNKFTFFKEKFKNKVVKIITFHNITDEEDFKKKFEKLVKKYNIQLLYCPLLSLQPITFSVPSVVLIPDMQHKYYSNFFNQEVLKWRETKFQESSLIAEKIITLSNTSKNDIVKFLEVDNNKVVVSYLDAPFWIKEKIDKKENKKFLKKYNLKEKNYFFYPANSWPHKNHKNLIKAFLEITKIKKYKNLKLVLTGYNMKQFSLRDKILTYDYVKNEDIKFFYNNSKALIFPSLFEGFGIPLLEAINLDCPIICSNISTAKEIVENSGIFFDPHNYKDIKKKILYFLENEKEIIPKLIKNYKSIKNKFSYKKTIKKTLLLFKKTISSNKKIIKYPKISIITPSYNQGRFLEKTIKSVINQRYPNLEYIIIDGGSTDNSLKIIKKYEKYLKYWVSEKDRGQTHAINKGLRKATGDILAYLNSDDTLESKTLFKVAKLFTDNKKIKIIYGQGKHIDEKDKFIENYHNGYMDFSKVQSSNDICQPALFFKKEILKKIGFFDESLNYAMDYEYWIRAAKKYNYKLVYIEDFFANSRLYVETKTLSQTKKVILEVFKIQKKYYSEVHDDWIVSYAYQLLKKLLNQIFFIRLFFYPLIIFMSLILILIINKRFPYKSTLKYYKNWIKNFFKELLSLPLIIKHKFFQKYEEIAILYQHKPKKAYIEKFPKEIYKTKKFLKISIITPSYNQGRFLEKTIKSVINQRYPNLEYIIIDGGSTDNSLKIIKKYEKYLKYWVSEKDRGQTHAINKGLRKATGDILAYLNSDDKLMDKSLFFINYIFQKYKNVDVVYGHRILIDTKDKQIGRWINYRHDPKVLRFIDYIPQETMFWTKKAWIKVGKKLDEKFKFAMDWDLIIKFLDKKLKFKRLPYFLGYFRVHQKQKTQNKKINKEVEYIRYKQFKTKIPQQDIDKLLIKYRRKAAIISFLFDLGIRI